MDIKDNFRIKKYEIKNKIYLTEKILIYFYMRINWEDMVGK